MIVFEFNACQVLYYNDRLIILQYTYLILLSAIALTDGPPPMAMADKRLACSYYYVEM